MRAFAGIIPGLPPLERVRNPGTREYPIDNGAPRAVTHIPPGTRAVLAPNNRPQLVWLPDPEDRNTARPVPPGDLPGAIAPDVQLREVWIEITREPVTRQLGAQLPWLAVMLTDPPPVGLRWPGEYRMFADALSQGVNP